MKKALKKFIHLESSAGIILAFCAVVAMALANSPLSDDYFSFLDIKIFGLSLQHWINDGLMVIFFFVIGMELKKEILAGELSSLKKAALPVAAALGGMIVPAIIYAVFNFRGEGASGWGIPMATDIAFALGILSLFGKRVPLSLKVFLLALAIVDDLGAILVIAFFYTKEIRVEGLLLAALGLGSVVALKRFRIKSYFFYIALGVVTWFGVLYSGIHATIAGVSMGLLTPLIFQTSSEGTSSYSPLDQLVQWLHPWVSFGIMPIFALANAGISLRGLNVSELIVHPVHQGVALGLVLGKAAGIFLFSRIFVLMGWGRLPDQINWGHILGMGFLGGVGFTMALFISNLALPANLEAFSKTGIILGSGVSGILGSLVLIWSFGRTSSVKNHAVVMK